MNLNAYVFVASITFVAFAAAGVETDAVKAAAASADKWLALVDDGKYAQSWREAAVYFRAAVTETNWVTSLNGVRKPLGKVGSRKAGTTLEANSLPGAPDGKYVALQFDTSFENKKSAVETVTCVLEKGGKWKVAGYFIK
jgi:Protein of unknown function (DUF4019)